jgi:HAD superfamily hydrolase (TIGR01549 family)
MRFRRDIQAVTFDCWGTLIYDEDPEPTFEVRAKAFFELLMKAGVETTLDETRNALHLAWQRHNDCWTRETSTGSPEVARWALESFGINDQAYVHTLIKILQEALTHHDIRVLEGAEKTLQELQKRNIHRGLICDTGLVPSSVVKTFLSSVNLIDHLEILVFSDEVGVPKPNQRMFQAALDGLHTQPELAVHVGDLKRSDVAGARNMGMVSIRIR